MTEMSLSPRDMRYTLCIKLSARQQAQPQLMLHMFPMRIFKVFFSLVTAGRSKHEQGRGKGWHDRQTRGASGACQIRVSCVQDSEREHKEHAGAPRGENLFVYISVRMYMPDFDEC